MKEASGELNMTVVTVVAIAAVAAFFYAFVWPTVKQNIVNSTKCANAICDNTTCSNNGGKTTCTSCSDPAGDDKDTFKCVFSDSDATGVKGGAAKTK